MCKSSVASDIATGLFFFRMGKPSFYQQRNVCAFENSKLTGHHLTTASSISGKEFAAIVADVNELTTPSHLRFSHLLFVICADAES